jgi:hypothetical protein
MKKPVKSIKSAIGNWQSAMLLAFALFALSAVKCPAQIFTGGVGVLGTSNAVVQLAFQTQTNPAFCSLIGRTLQIPHIDTNQTVTVAYGHVFSGYGLTNLWIDATNQYSFPASNGWVQGQSWTTNIPAANFTVPVTPVGQIQVYTNGTANAASNNFIFQ